MKAVLRAIFRASQRHSALPLYDFMRDDSIPVRGRLSFYPCLTLVVMALDDLSKYVMRDERSSEKYQQLVNAHAWEGDNRWAWYLADLANLGFDQPASTSAVLRSVFSEETRIGRMLGPRLAHLAYGAAPIEKLVIIEAIEAAGGMLFGLIARLANEIRAEHGATLRHLGAFDFSRRSGAGMSENRMKWLREISLEAGGRTRCMTHVERVFYLFSEWTGELLAFAVTDRAAEFRAERAIDEALAQDGRAHMDRPLPMLARSSRMP